MSDLGYLQERTANEPKVHPFVKNSFIFVPTAGMRLSPEMLVLELMREVFLGQHYKEGETKAKDLDPDEHNEEGGFLFSTRERAILYALRGRRKKTKSSADQTFFAPAYPQLAEEGWLRKRSERVVNNFLFSGPVAQHLYYGEQGSQSREEREAELLDIVWKALIGGNSCLDETLSGKEILAVTLQPESFEEYKDRENASRFMKKMIHSRHDTLLNIPNDELAACITNDLMAICNLENQIPRMQWLHLLMTFLRFALPMWLLAQMQMTHLVHGWLLGAIDERSDFPSTRRIYSVIARRNRDLLHPTLTPTREIFDHIDRYMKCRVELDILLYCLSEINKDKLDPDRGNTKLNLDGGGKGRIGIEELIMIAGESAQKIRELDRFKSIAVDCDVQTFLTREGEQFSAWRKPRKSGQGKNIDEFFRVLYQPEIGDESGGYLLNPVGQGAKRGFVVFPGQLLLKTMTYLSAQAKWSSNGGGGILVLQDVEDHFARYGIDFSNAADARPKLMEQLQSMGLLKGSPDAGSSVAVEIPY
jgi:hypothetical protein